MPDQHPISTWVTINGLTIDPATWGTTTANYNHQEEAVPIQDEDTDTCDRCNASVPESTLTMHDDDWTCPDCLRNCARCEVSEADRTLYEVQSYRGTQHYCRNCSVRCYECGGRLVPEDAYYLSDNHYCLGCTETCASCGDRIPGSDTYCWDCDSNSDFDFSEGNGIRGWGCTSPTMWCGGPTPKDDSGKQLGFFVGVEHEIYASRSEGAMHVHRFAEQHGVPGFFDCKEDSSVDGYEIATQPMTPEFFESFDWEGYMAMLNKHHPLPHGMDEEYEEHGIHVHIGRIAFDRDPVAIAAFTYLLSQGEHLERIARRAPYHYCEKVLKPVKAAIIAASRSDRETAQSRRISYNEAVRLDRDAVNLTNSRTIEIRAFRSTRSANDLRDAVRVVYIGAEYVRHLRATKNGLNRDRLSWTEFARWVAVQYPEAFASIAGLPTKGSNRMSNPRNSW